MTSALSTWRLARRMVRRAPGRSLLIALLVAIPVIAGVLVVVTIRTAQLSPEQAAHRYIGTADAVALVTEYPSVDLNVSTFGRQDSWDGAPTARWAPDADHQTTREPTAVDLLGLLPATAHAVPEHVTGNIVITAHGQRLDVIGTVHDFADPLANGTFDVLEGRPPRGSAEVAVTPSLARTAHLRIGDDITLTSGHARVTAVVRSPAQLSLQSLVGAASAYGGLSAFANPNYSQQVTWLIHLADPAPDLRVRLAAHGILYDTRAQWEQPADVANSNINPEAVAILVSIALFGLAEIVFLAGTAIAVGTRRQLHELGLLQAVGGDRRHVRGVVLAQAVLLGAAGGILGIAGGVTAFVVFRSRLEDFVDRGFGPIDLRWREMLAVALIAVLSALLAAVVPARSCARLTILDTLRSRFPSDTRPRNPRWAWAALGLGPAIVVGAAIGWHHAGASAAGASANARDALWTSSLSFGAAVTLAGIARSVPLILTRAGRLAHRLPLGPRLALRDSARHWHRSAPAAAAVTTVVAATVASLFAASSTELRDRRTYTPNLPAGMVSVVVDNSDSGSTVTQARLAELAHGTAASLHAPSVGLLSLVRAPLASVTATVFTMCPATTAGDSCTSDGPLVVADAGAVALLAGPRAADVNRALAGGAAVAFDPHLVMHGTVALSMSGPENDITEKSLPAVVIPIPQVGNLPKVVVSAATARERGWTMSAYDALLRPVHLPSERAERAAAADLGQHAGLYVERGYRGHLGLALFILLIAAVVSSLAGTSIAVALAMAEGRADLATLAAVGAAPGRRRMHAVSQAATVAVLGTGTGLLLGVLMGVALMKGATTYPLSIPYRWGALTVLGIPLLAMATAGAVTRSHVPLSRRLT